MCSFARTLVALASLPLELCVSPGIWLPGRSSRPLTCWLSSHLALTALRKATICVAGSWRLAPFGSTAWMPFILADLTGRRVESVTRRRPDRPRWRRVSGTVPGREGAMVGRALSVYSLQARPL